MSKKIITWPCRVFSGGVDTLTFECRTPPWMLKGILGNIVKAEEMVWGLVGPLKKETPKLGSRQTNNDTMCLGCTHLNWHAFFQKCIKVKIFFNGSSSYQCDTLGPDGPRTHPAVSLCLGIFLKRIHLERGISVWSPPKGVRGHIFLKVKIILPIFQSYIPSKHQD